MKFAQTVALFLPLFGVAIADRHGRCWCASHASAGAGGGWTAYQDETIAACNRYLHRDTGDKPFDKCPDCTTTDGASPSPFKDISPCHSPGGHLGGDEFTYYCEQVSGDRLGAFCKE